jgi:hypothetical protein
MTPNAEPPSGRLPVNEDRDHALEWMRRTLPAIRRAILKELPGLSDRLENYPPKHMDSKP